MIRIGMGERKVACSDYVGNNYVIWRAMILSSYG